MNQASERREDGWATFLTQMRQAAGPRAGVCPTDDQLEDYAADALGADDWCVVEQHLATCSRCCAELERVFDTADRWLNASSAPAVSQLAARLADAWFAADVERLDGSVVTSPVAAIETARKPPRAKPRVVNWRAVALAAASVALVAASAALVLQERRHRTEVDALRSDQGAMHLREEALRQQLEQLERERPSDALPQREAVAPPSVVALTLLPGTLRGLDHADTRTLVLPASATEVVLSLLLREDASDGGYDVLVTTAEGRVIADQRRLQPHPDVDGDVLSLRLTARLLTTEDYVVKVNDPNAGDAIVEAYSMRVKRVTQ